MYAAIDVLVRCPMKRAARCVMHCELYDSVNQLTCEHTLWCLGTPGTCMLQCRSHSILDIRCAIHNVGQLHTAPMCSTYSVCACWFMWPTFARVWTVVNVQLYAVTALYTVHSVQRVIIIMKIRHMQYTADSCCICTWSRACTPAKFKHIGKRRRMHNVVCLQSLRMNKGYVIVTIM